MLNPWDVYLVLWQNGQVLSTQQLNESNKRIECILKWFTNNTNYCYEWGVNSIDTDLLDLQKGRIIINSVNCSFPQGQPFIYDKFWKTFNGENYSIDNEHIYKIEINLEDYSTLLNNNSTITLGLSLVRDSFQNIEFIAFGTETRDVTILDDINPVFRQFPKVSLIPGDLYNINKNDFLPLFKVSIVNGIYKLMDYDPPSCFVRKGSFLNKLLSEFIKNIYKKVCYIQQSQQAKNKDSEIARFLQVLMSSVFSMNSLMETQTSCREIYKVLLNCLGSLETFADFNFNVYSYNHLDLLSSFKKVIDRINNIAEEFYSLGQILYFRLQENGVFSLDINFTKLKRQDLFLDISCSPIDKSILENWVETSIITTKTNLDEKSIIKDRGLDRELISSNVQGNENGFTVFLRYKLDFSSLKNQETLVIYNPQVLRNLTIVLVDKNS